MTTGLLKKISDHKRGAEIRVSYCWHSRVEF
jgi:hypothetical protein